VVSIQHARDSIGERLNYMKLRRLGSVSPKQYSERERERERAMESWQLMVVFRGQVMHNPPLVVLSLYFLFCPLLLFCYFHKKSEALRLEKGWVLKHDMERMSVWEPRAPSLMVVAGTLSLQGRWASLCDARVRQTRYVRNHPMTWCASCNTAFRSLPVGSELLLTATSAFDAAYGGQQECPLETNRQPYRVYVSASRIFLWEAGYIWCGNKKIRRRVACWLRGVERSLGDLINKRSCP